MEITFNQIGLTKETFMTEVRFKLIYYHKIQVTDAELLERWKAGDNVSNAISYFLLHK